MPMADLTTAQKSRSKAPSLLACISCRKSHLKCNGVKPVCSRCADRDVECVWMDSRRGYRDYRKTSSTKTESSNPDESSAPFCSDTQSTVTGTFVLNPIATAAQTCTYQELFGPTFAPQSGMELQLAFNDIALSPMSSDSTASITREHSPSQSHHGSVKKSSDLLEVFYKNFHVAHPFLIPKKLYLSRPTLLPEPLKAVMRFLASNYIPSCNTEALRSPALTIMSGQVPDDGFKVQGLLLFAFASFAHYEMALGRQALELATQMALDIGMNRHSFAIAQSPNSLILQESWRRTWWSLFILNGIVTAVNSQEQPFNLQDVYSDVSVPNHDEDYNNCLSNVQPRSVSDFRDRTFSEDNYEWSSFAYVIEAMYIMGAVFKLGTDTFAITDPQVEAVDVSISNFLLSLPPSKREVTSPDGHTDETLLMAHVIINWASILVHRPRSSLTFIRNHYKTICTHRFSAAGLPALAYASHTSKTIRAANALISLASIPRPLSYCTPLLMCGITTAATVHLPAYALADRHATAVAIKERLQLAISALGAFAEIWPRASIAKSQVASFAREVLTKPNVSVDSTGVGMVPTITTCQETLEPAEVSQLEYGMSFDENTWINSMIETDKDESIGVDEGALMTNGIGQYSG